MDALEAVADAIMHYEGWSNGSRSNRNRNPGNLRAGEGMTGSDPQGYARFPSLIVGYGALLADLAAKFAGPNERGLGPGSSLFDLFAVYAPAGDDDTPARYADFVAGWLSIALGRRFTRDSRLGDIWPPRAAAAAAPAEE